MGASAVDGAGVGAKPGYDKAGTFEDYVAPLSSTRPLNQYRRTTTAAASGANSGISSHQHQSNASPKPGENKRRTAVNHHNSGAISVYGASAAHQSSAKADSKQQSNR